MSVDVTVYHTESSTPEGDVVLACAAVAGLGLRVVFARRMTGQSSHGRAVVWTQMPQHLVLVEAVAVI